MSLIENVAPIELLRRQYLQCLDPEQLKLPKPEILKLPEIQSQIHAHMFDDGRLKYPPPERYRFRVLKRILAALERAIEDPEEDVCNISRAKFLFQACLAIERNCRRLLLICPLLLL